MVWRRTLERFAKKGFGLYIALGDNELSDFGVVWSEKVLRLTKNRMSLVLAICIFAVPLTGCRSARDKMRASRFPRNTFFDAEEMLADLNLEEGESAWMGARERTDGQSVHVLLIAPDAELKPRFHRRHDLTLFCVRGGGIVEVEGDRYFVKRLSALTIPRLHAYKIMPHNTEKETALLMVFSPPYEGKDSVLVKD